MPIFVPILFACVITCVIVMMLFINCVLDPVDRFRRGLANQYIHESWLSGFLIERFKIRKVSRPNGGITLQFRSPFTKWETMDTYGSASYEQARLDEDLAKMWKAVEVYIEQKRFVPVIEVLTLPVVPEEVAVVEEKE